MVRWERVSGKFSQKWCFRNLMPIEKRNQVLGRTCQECPFVFLGWLHRILERRGGDMENSRPTVHVFYEKWRFAVLKWHRVVHCSHHHMAMISPTVIKVSKRGWATWPEGPFYLFSFIYLPKCITSSYDLWCLCIKHKSCSISYDIHKALTASP